MCLHRCRFAVLSHLPGAKQSTGGHSLTWNEDCLIKVKEDLHLYVFTSVTPWWKFPVEMLIKHEECKFVQIFDIAELQFNYLDCEWTISITTWHFGEVKRRHGEGVVIGRISSHVQLDTQICARGCDNYSSWEWRKVGVVGRLDKQFQMSHDVVCFDTCSEHCKLWTCLRHTLDLLE